jgi:hypothetical protein
LASESAKRLGNPDIAEVAKRGRAALKANARRFAANVRPIIEEIVRSGITSHNAHFDILAGSVGVQKADPKNASRCRW